MTAVASTDFLEFVECAGCGELFPIRSKFGRGAKWCSERCRKAQYSVPCEDCGQPVNGSDGRWAHRWCGGCGPAHGGASSAAIQRAKWQPHRAKIEAMWREGRSCREIADVMGIPSFTSGSYRQKGYDLPYRRTGFR